MMNSQEKEVMFNINNKETTSSMVTSMVAPNEESRTFHSLPLGGPAAPVLPRSKSFGFKPNRVRNLHWSSATTQTGLEVARDSATTKNDNKNSLARPLVTGPQNPPVGPNVAHSKGLCSMLGKFFLQGFGNRVPKAAEPSREIRGDQATNNGGNQIRLSSDRVPVDEQMNNPRKKAKRSENVDVKEESFMNYCFGCHRRLKENEDIYIYRGEMAFCSVECREREILIHEKKRKEASSSSKKPTIRDVREG